MAVFLRKECVTLREKFQLFEYRFNDEELEEEFNNFFYKYNLTALFTNEHRAGNITVTWVDARSVINPNGSYHRILKDFADLLSIGNDNKAYEEALFKIIYEARSFQGMMNTIKKLLDYANTIETDYKFNLWNIVFYNKEVY